MRVGRAWQGDRGPLDFIISHFPIKVLVEKCFSLSFKLSNIGHTPGKNPSDGHDQYTERKS